MNAAKRATASGPDAEEYGVDLLLRKLKGVTRDSENRYKALCPLHDDNNPSLSISIGWRDQRPKLLIHCHVCGPVFRELLDSLHLDPWKVQTNLHFVDVAYRPSEDSTPPQPVELGAEASATVERFRQALANNESQMSWICERRGLEWDTVREAGIGFDGHRFVVPITRHGKLVGIKRYDADGGSPKWQTAPGTRAALYPDPVRMHDEPWLTIVEGEWDALIGQQHGLPTYSPTHGASGYPRDEWLPYFIGKKVALCFDCDDPGREGAKRWAEWLNSNGVSCWTIDLGLGHKEDLSDFFTHYGRTRGDFLRLVREAKRFRG